jgi:hypothetical protein
MINPFTQHLISPVTVRLPSSRISVGVARCHFLFKPWQGKPLPDTYGGKAVLDFGGQPVYAELAILRTPQETGWDGVWVDTYGRQFRRDLPPDSCELPSHALERYKRICRANGDKVSGCFDVFAWKGPAYLFVESKGGKDSIHANQTAWVEAALRSGVPLDSLLICEWELERHDPRPKR